MKEKFVWNPNSVVHDRHIVAQLEKNVVLISGIKERASIHGDLIAVATPQELSKLGLYGVPNNCYQISELN